MSLIGILLVRNEQCRWLEQVLVQMSSVCDRIVVLDDASTDRTPDICRKHGATVFHAKESMWGIDEARRRKELWHLANPDDNDWILCLDADETIPQIFLLPDVIKVAEQYGCDGVALRLYDMWNETHYRDDKWWMGHKGSWLMCARYDANKAYEWNDTPLHCGRFPKNACEKLAQTELAIQHWGWSKSDDRQIKYDRYKRADPEGKYGFMGQYESILDPDPVLRRFGE